MLPIAFIPLTEPAASQVTAFHGSHLIVHECIELISGVLLFPVASVPVA